jgi:thiol:disulfide interchange protein DsbD
MPAGPLMNFGYEGDTLLLTTLQVGDVRTGTPVALNAKVEWLECKDVCIPGSADVSLTLPVKAASAPSSHASLFTATRKLVPAKVPGLAARGTIESNRIRLAFDLPSGKKADAIEFFPLEEARIEPAAAQVLNRNDGVALYLTAAQPVKADAKSLSGVLVVDGGPAKPGGWTAVVEAPLVAGVVSPAAMTSPSAAPAAATAPTMSLIAALGAAFVGGLILNLMPCVFPVLSLKLIGLAQHRTHSGPMAAHGAAFAAGVILSFVLLAGLLIALQQAGSALGWGFQLQTPWVAFEQ